MVSSRWGVLTFSQATIIVAALLALYFPGAVYLHYSYVPKPDPPKAAQLAGPFRKLDDTAYQILMPTLDGYADTGWGTTRSTIILFEDGRQLGPAHSPTKIASGSYSHFSGSGIIFSASDNSDPNTNGRTYSVTWR
ncbi:hypothetical protein QA645_19530 [Bradyrhizobium sp. CIAT3101]|uniref:hypothetical protein n=1 Tax=Bradyrhizobium sp. CIAT3101 TaxID=439387 RepID=UPI0024B115F9|nr:hypothetical protein [Bradyrhizobium sp. CIAT3101]WFU84848.1 hypothetical protein QA645_19530 [Bradyrhizobium sp. CIAT3101]